MDRPQTARPQPERPQPGRTTPPSPGDVRRSLSARLQTVWRGNRNSVATTLAGDDDDEGDAATLAEELEDRRRSVSRGREAFKSTGRGGAGNIHASPSVGPDADEDFSPSRGREVDDDPAHTKSSGRGGLGNIRSRSRATSASQVPEGSFPKTASIVSENAASTAAYEQRVVEEATKAAAAVHSSGRGGAGNISGSRSRSRGPGKFFGVGGDKLHSTGRGGAGNLQSTDLTALDSRQEAELYGPFSEDGLHSTGRGGRANMSATQSPPPEQHAPQALAYENSGRGGAGNIHSRSKSRDPAGPRSRSRDPLSRMWQKVTHPHGARDIQEERAPSAAPAPASGSPAAPTPAPPDGARPE